MRRANFIVGFNNWGKSTIVHTLFNCRRFQRNSTYQLDILPSVRFCVQSQSNDDIGQQLIDQISFRLQQSKNVKPDLFSSLCPSLENNNDCRQILREPVFSQFNQLNLFLLKFKWDHHAELMESNIISYLNGIDKINFYTIDSDASLPENTRADSKIEQIRNILRTLYLEGH